MSLSRRAMFKHATVGGTAILGAAALPVPQAALAQDANPGEYILVCIENGVRIRSEPGLDGDVRGTIHKGDRVRVTGVSVEADGYRWVPIHVVGASLLGWTTTEFLRLPDGGEIGWLPGTVVHVNTTRVNLHAGAGVNYDIVGNFNTGTEAVINEGPTEADSYAWYNITIDNVTGWMVEDYLTEGRYADTSTARVSATAASAGTSWKLVAASDAPQGTRDTADYVCDGVDDHVEIQAAIDSLAKATNGGGTVWLSTGTFMTGKTVTQLSRISVKGVGGYNTLGSPDGGTLIRRQASFTGDLPMWAFEVAWWGGDLGFLTFDGNRANIASGTGDNVRLQYAAEGSEIHHVLSINSRGDGFQVEGESTPATLRQCSAFANAGWGFNLNGITRVVTLSTPSGDSNGAGLLRIAGGGPSAITSVILLNIKGERNYTSPASGNDPAIRIENYDGPVTIIGGALDGVSDAGAPGTTAVQRIGAGAGPVLIRNLRIAGYTTQFDDRIETLRTVARGTGTTTLTVDTSTPPGAQDTYRVSKNWISRSTANYWYTSSGSRFRPPTGPRRATSSPRSAHPLRSAPHGTLWPRWQTTGPGTCTPSFGSGIGRVRQRPRHQGPSPSR